MKTTHFIIIMPAETLLQSWLRDASTFALFAGLIGLGAWIESEAAQWAGAMIAFIFLVTKASGIARPRKFSPDEAHAEVDRIAAVIEAEKSE